MIASSGSLAGTWSGFKSDGGPEKNENEMWMRTGRVGFPPDDRFVVMNRELTTEKRGENMGL